MLTVLEGSGSTIQEYSDLSRAAEAAKGGKSVCWVDIAFDARKDDPAEVKQVGEVFRFHPVVSEDLASLQRRPRIKVYESSVFLVWQALADDPTTPRLEVSALKIALGRHLLVTVHDRPIAEIDKMKAVLMEDPKLLTRGADWLLYLILDALVYEYFPLVERISDEVNRMEDTMIRTPSEDDLHNVLHVKRQLLAMSKTISLEREVLRGVTRPDGGLVAVGSRPYFENVFDHLLMVIDLVETARDEVSGAMDVYLSSVSNRLNDIMKRLTIVATIFMPLTLISSIYGMNFRYMPELNVKGFYFGVLGAMVAIVIGMLAYFKRRNWF